MPSSQIRHPSFFTRLRNLERMREITQVAVKHGFGYFFETTPPADPASAGAPEATPAPCPTRSAHARDAGRAGPHLRQVRADAEHEARHPAQGHPGRAGEASGQGHSDPVLGSGRGRETGAGPDCRQGFRELRAGAFGLGVHRPGARRRACPVDRVWWSRCSGPTPPGSSAATSIFSSSLPRSWRTGWTWASRPIETVQEFARSIGRELDYGLEARNALRFAAQSQGQRQRW